LTTHFESVDRYYKDNLALLEFLESKGELSHKLWAEASMAKVIIIAGAGALEVEMCAIVRRFVSSIKPNDPLVMAIVERKAITRQYHTWFSWPDRNAGPFYSLFGSDFSKAARLHARQEAEFERRESSFLSIGQERNEIAHGAFCSVQCSLSHREAYEKFLQAKLYCSDVERLLCSYQVERHGQATTMPSPTSVPALAASTDMPVGLAATTNTAVQGQKRPHQ
jgi:hypothetical protein